MRNILMFCVFVSVTFYFCELYAIPAKKQVINIIQSDGTKLRVYPLGDENFSWYTSEDDYTLLYNENGILEYAILNDSGELTNSHVKAHNIDERTSEETHFLIKMPKNLFFPQKQIEKIIKNRIPSIQYDNPLNQISPVIGTKKFLVILVEYPDVQFSHSRSEFQNLLNQEGYQNNGATGSVKDYFRATSFGKLNLETTVVGPYILPNNRDFYGAPVIENGMIVQNDANPWQMIIDGCKLAGQDIDFSDFDGDGDGFVDGVHVIYAGLGQANGGNVNTVWPHRSQINLILDNVTIKDYSCSAEMKPSGMSGIGTICHELGHVLGLLDYYDTDYAANGVTPTLGTLDIMDIGSYNNDENTPPLYNAFSRIRLGWVEPIILNSGSLHEYTAYPIQDSNQVFRINTLTEGEYFLIENKQRTGWDEYMYNGAQYFGGLVILHIDENGPGWNDNCLNCYASHPSVKIIHADNKADGQEYGGAFRYQIMYNDVFPGTENITSFTDQTQPGTRSWNGENTDVPLLNITMLGNRNIIFQTYDANATGIKLVTLSPVNITQTSCILRANLQNDNDVRILERGFVCDTLSEPLSQDNEWNISLEGDFEWKIENLLPGIYYYYRAHVKTEEGNIYGGIKSFLTLSESISNNYISDTNISACLTGEVPVITASIPEGANGKYTYQWLKSEDNVNYTIPLNTSQGKDYTPQKMDKPLWFKRVVLSADKVDTSSAKFVPVANSTIVGSVISEKGSIRLGESTGLITLTQNAGNVLYWERKSGNLSWERIENTENKQDIEDTPNEINNYAYRARVRNGACMEKISNSAIIEVKSARTSDIFDEINNNKSIVIYPNPTTGIVYIKTDEIFAEAKVYDVKGMQIQKTGSRMIDLSSYPAGIYLIKLNGCTKMIVKQ